jgi:hypothetical protein
MNESKPWLTRMCAAFAFSALLCSTPALAQESDEPPVAADDADSTAAEQPADEEQQPDGDAENERGQLAPIGKDAAAAQSLWQLGKALLDMGRFDKACPKLEQSMALAPMADVALLLADCLERDGKVASAWAEYRQAGLMLAQAGRKDEAELARAHAVDLEPRVPKLTVAPAVELPGMDVLRDGVSFGPGIFGVAVAIDPGKHTVEVRAPGYQTWSTEVTVGGNGDRQVVAVPELAADSATTATPTKRSSARSSSKRGILFTSGIITTGSGLATLGVGVILGLVASRDVEMAESDDSLCGGDHVCTQEGYDLIERAEDKALGSTVAIAVGSVAVAAGFVLVILDGRVGSDGSGADSVSARLAPLAGPGLGGLQMTVGF